MTEQQPTADLTPASANAIGQASANAAAAAPPDQRQQAAHDAAVTEAKARGLSDEDAQKLAAMMAPLVAAQVHEHFRQAGAFEPPPAPAPIEHAQPTDQPTAVEQERGYDPAAAQTPPRKRTWAEKFVGRQ